MVEDNSDIVAIVSNLHISMISELNMADAKSKSPNWWYDTSATIHVCNNKSYFKSLEDARVGQQVQMEITTLQKSKEKGLLNFSLLLERNLF